MGNKSPRPKPDPEPPQKTGPRKIRMVIVGASSVGKTCMITNYNTSAYNTDYIPSVLDIFKGEREINGHKV